MRRTGRAGTALAAAWLAALPASLEAQSETEIASLEDIGKLEIVVEDLAAPAATVGLSGADLRALLEERLRAGGVPVAGFAVAFLTLSVTAIPLTPGPDVVLHTALAFHQPAASTLNRWLGPARTWSLERLTVTGMSRSEEALKADVEHLAEAFVAAWAQANSESD